jgi:hypothetical protein
MKENKYLSKILPLKFGFKEASKNFKKRNFILFRTYK